MVRKKEPIDYTKIIKTLDPIFQTIIFVSFFFLFDLKGHKEHFAMVKLIQWQLGSVIVNAILRYSKKLKYERFFSFASLVTWYLLYHFMFAKILEGKMKEKYFNVIVGKGLSSIPLFDTFFELSALAIGFWYFSICIREIQYLYKKRRKSKSRR